MKTITYILFAILCIPLLPVMYFSAKRIRKEIPLLPEAKEPTGVVECPGVPIEVVFLGESTIAGVGVEIHHEGFAGFGDRHQSGHVDKLGNNYHYT